MTQKAVIVTPTDNVIGPCGEVTYDLLKKLGMNVELQETDWGTVVQRRNSRKPVEAGGWSIIHTVWPSDAIYTPMTSAILRGQGDKGWFGWFADDKIEQLNTDFLRATDQAARLSITNTIQQEALAGADNPARSVLHPLGLPRGSKEHGGGPGAIFLGCAARLKRLAGAPPGAITASRDTATNPNVFEAFALAIIGGFGPRAHPGIPDHEPRLAEARNDAITMGNAMDELRKFSLAPASYVSESSYFEKEWQESYWGANYFRLQAIKANYDPGGLFFVHHGVGSEDWNVDGFERLTTN